MSENIGGNAYVDFERISKVDGYVYYWILIDLLKTTKEILSSKEYKQGDCKLFKYKRLSTSFHAELMGGGVGETINSKNPEWGYPSPNSANELILKSVCSF